mgnify:CR=1 FL=1
MRLRSKFFLNYTKTIVSTAVLFCDRDLSQGNLETLLDNETYIRIY